jgi:hypothetical protein
MRSPYPGHLQIIPDDWSPDQALAVFELLDLLRDLVCDRYGTLIQDCMRSQYQTDIDPGTPTDPPF